MRRACELLAGCLCAISALTLGASGPAYARVVEGSVVAWGAGEPIDPDSTQCDVPEPNEGFVAVAAGVYCSLGLKGDGTVVIWGWDEYGECDVPEPNEGFVAVAAGAVHSLGLRDDGSIVAWGAGQPGESEEPHYGQSDVPEPNEGFVAVAAGAVHSLGLRDDGSVVAWGAGQPGESEEPHYGQSDVPEPNDGFVAISAGALHSLGLMSDGTIVAWGAGKSRNPGLSGRVPHYNQYDVPKDDEGFVGFPAGHLRCLGLENEEAILAQGAGRSGQLVISEDYPHFGQCDVPEPNEGFVAIAAGGFHSLGLKRDGTVVAWGYNEYGQCDVPAPNEGFVAIAAGYYQSLGLKSDGTVVAWGWNRFGQCDVPEPNEGFLGIAANGYHSLGVKGDGTIVAWGACEPVSLWPHYGQSDVPEPNEGFAAVSAGYFHSLGLKRDETVAAWGLNNLGQCDVPEPNEGFVAIAAGGSHSLGLKGDGTIVAWGAGQPGQSGDHDFGQSDVPEPNEGFVAIAAGPFHSLGLKGEGRVVAWGAGQPDQSSWPHYGQSDVPEPNEGFVAIAAGGYHSLGLKSDGTVVAWGDNDFGQSDVPLPNEGFVAIAAGLFHSLGLKGDGTIVAWGDNWYGQSDVPPPNEGFVAIAAGGFHSLGLKGDGTITAWGAGQPYQSGDYDFCQSDVPEPNDGFVVIATGLFHSLGLRDVDPIPAAISTPVAEVNRDGRCTIEVEVTAPLPGLVTAHCRNHPSAAYVGIRMSARLPGPDRFVYTATVPDTLLGPHGMQYYIQWKAGGFLHEYPQDWALNPLIVSAPLENRSWADHPGAPEIPDAGLAPDQTSYRMIGFPFAVEPDRSSVTDVFVDDLGEPDEDVWKVLRWNGAQGEYDRYVGVGPITAGRGYWLIRRGTAAVGASGWSSVPDTLYEGQRYVIVEVEEGWNQIASPLGFAVSWSGRRVEGTTIEERLVSYGGASGYTSVSVLQPWVGYWVKAEGGGQLWLPYSVADLGEGRQLARRQASAERWQVGLELESGGLLDGCMVLGVEPGASDRHDHLDCSEPPMPPGGHLSLSSVLSDGDGSVRYLKRDYRAAGHDLWRFTLRVRGSGGGAARLGLAESTHLPEGFAVVLVDSGLGQVLDLRGEGSVVLPRALSAGGDMYKLLVGPESLVWPESGPPTAVVRSVELSGNRPNPFTPRTMISFALPGPQPATLVVYDILGREVVRLVDGMVPGGRHEVAWDGRDGGGRLVSSGVYLCRLQSGGRVLTRRLTLVR